MLISPAASATQQPRADDGRRRLMRPILSRTLLPLQEQESHRALFVEAGAQQLREASELERREHDHGAVHQVNLGNYILDSLVTSP